MLERLVINTMEHIKEIETVEYILDEVRATSSTNAKKVILSNNKDNKTLQKVLEYTYNPHKKFGVSDIEKIYEIMPCDTPAFGVEIWDILDKLANNNINDELRQELRDYLVYFDAIAETLEGIVTKDLKLGVNATTINKIWKGLIPTSETGVEIKPMLASKFDITKPPTAEFAVTEKLDGIRCMAICTSEGIELYSRQGKLIEGCIEVEDALRKLQAEWDCDFVLDGELLANDCDYETVYKETTKRIKNKNAVKTGVHYMAFDAMDITEFRNQKCTTPYYKRVSLLTQLRNTVGESPSLKFIQLLYLGNDTNRLLMLLDEYRAKGAEGLMVNLLDAPYEFKRSKAILKVKVMETVDLKIIGFEEGSGKNEGKLGALIVDYKGYECGVGSGFSDYEREYIWQNKDQYLGKICEVQYFEETKNKDGGVSLRFPVFKHLRLDKTEPSYN